MTAALGEWIDSAVIFASSSPTRSSASRRNLAFAGTLVTSGRAEGLVFEIGDRTETGRIARLVSEAREIATPLTRKIARCSHSLL